MLPTALSFPAVVTIDQFGKVVRLLSHFDELVFKKIPSGGSLYSTIAESERCGGRRETEHTSRGSRARHRDINSLNDLEKSPPSVGGGFLGIRNST